METRTVRYCVVHGESHADLETRVNSLIAQGWRPQGGVLAVVKWERDGDGCLQEDWHYHQAMTMPFHAPPAKPAPKVGLEEI